MTNPYQPEMTIPALGGRAGVSQQSKIFQMFAALVSPVNALAVPDLTLLEPGWERHYQPQLQSASEPLKQMCERLYRLSTGSQTVYRSSPNLAIPPLPSSAFANAIENNAPIPANIPAAATAALGGSGYYRVRATCSAARGPYVFYMDVDETIELFAFSVRLSLVGPAGSTLITPQNEQTITAQGNVIIDTRIGASLEPIESGTGLREALYTQLVPVAAGAQVAVPVAPYARSVRIIQDNVGAASSAWTRQVGTTTPLVVGQVAFDGRVSRVQDAPIGRESSLVTDLNNFNDRLFQVQWTIRP